MASEAHRSAMELDPIVRELVDRIMADPAEAPWSVQKNNVDYLLAQKGIDINRTLYGQTPFWIACKLGRLEAVEQMVETKFIAGRPNDMDVDAPSSAHETPFWIACSMGHAAVVRYLIPLIKDGVLDQPSMDGRTPLWTAARNEHAAVCEVLVEQKASAPGAPPPIMFERVIPAGRNRDLFTGGTTALQAARNQRHTRVCEILEGATASQRSGKARMRLLKSQQLTRAAVRMRDAEGVFFAPGKITEDMEVGRVTRELGNEEGIEYGAVEPPPEPEPGQSTAFKGKKKKGLR